MKPMLPFRGDAEKLKEYTENFFKNKPPMEGYDGPVPVSMETTEKSHFAIQSMFGVVQKKFNATPNKQTHALFMSLRQKLMASLTPFKHDMMDCLWKAKTPAEGEKCADQFITRVLTEGAANAKKLADQI